MKFKPTLRMNDAKMVFMRVRFSVGLPDFAAAILIALVLGDIPPTTRAAVVKATRSDLNSYGSQGNPYLEDATGEQRDEAKRMAEKLFPEFLT